MINLYNEYATDVIRGQNTADNFGEFVNKWNQAGGNAFESELAEKLGK